MNGRAYHASSVDLHLHSSASDGDLSPEQLAHRAAAAGVTVASLTDHDSFAAGDAFRQRFEALGGRAVTGCEVTTDLAGVETHLLVYGTEDTAFTRRVRRIHDEHLACLRERVDKAGAIGIPVTWEEVEEEIGADRIPYFGEILKILWGKARSDDRFSQYSPSTLLRMQRDWFEQGRPLYVPEPEWPQVHDVVRWARAAGGVPVLAHPARLFARRPQAQDLLPRLREEGLAGLEAWTTWHTASDVQLVLQLCADLDLIATQGSDFHGTRIKPWATQPGLMPGAAPDPHAMVDALLDA